MPRLVEDSDDEELQTSSGVEPKIKNNENEKETDDFDENEVDDQEEEEELEDEDEEDEEQEEEEQVEEEEDELSSEEEQVSSSKRSKSTREKPRKKIRSKFVDVEAEVDEEEDEEEYDDLEGELAKDDDFLEEGVDKEELEDRYENRLKIARRAQEEDFDVEQEEARLRELYGKQTRFKSFDVEAANAAKIPQQFLLPTARDPKLWVIKCRPGKERECVNTIMKKYMVRHNSGRPLQIYSVVCRDTLKGYIYVEAFKLPHVQDAIEKIPNLFASKVTLVPINEMVDVLKVKEKQIVVKPGGWVRVKRGKYAGDLAQILDVFDSGELVQIKLVPRLDVYAVSNMSDADKRKKSNINNRPPQKLFDPKEVHQMSKGSGEAVLARSRGYYQYKNESFKDGFLEKEVKISSLDVNGIKPSLEEVSKFTVGTGDNSQRDGESLLSRTAEINALVENVSVDEYEFEAGDSVIAISGELENLTGTVQSVLLDDVKVLADRTELTEVLTFKTSQLKKYFKNGDYVRVIRGKYKGERGLVVRVEDSIVTFFSDLTMSEIKCFARDLKKGAETTSLGASVNSRSGNYDILDMIQIDPHAVGVIVKIENDLYQVLDQNGEVRTLESLNELQQKKRDSRKTMSLDSKSNRIKVGDNVRIVDGEFKNRTGNVLHIFRSYIFVKSNEIISNCGVQVFRNSNIELIGVNKSVAATNPGIPNSMVSGFAAPIRAGGRGKKDPLVGKSVNITTGPYKGYLGIVKDANEITARVELHTKSKTITVEKSNLMLQDGSLVAVSSSNRYSSGSQPSYGRSGMLATGLQTPMVAGHQTPMVDGMGGRTPAWDAGARTPAWDAGSKTPAWDAGSKTPAWDAGARTPAWNDGSMSSYDTPGMSSMQTPRYGGPSGLGSSYVETPGTVRSTYNNNPETPGRYGVTEPEVTPYAEDNSGWFLEGILVQISSESPTAPGKSGVLESFPSSGVGICKIRIKGDDVDQVSVEGKYLQPVRASKRDRVKVIAGEWRSNAGTLMGIDGGDGIVRLDGKGAVDFKIIALQDLAKIEK